MGSSTAQDEGASPGGEKRSRKNPVNRIARAKLAEQFEKANPKPHRDVLGPVPSIAEQTRALMSDPGWLVQEMRRREDAADNPPGDPFEDFDLDDDLEEEIFTGYQLRDMPPIIPPETLAERQQPTEALDEPSTNPHEQAPPEGG